MYTSVTTPVTPVTPDVLLVSDLSPVSQEYITASSIELTIIECWGNSDYVGLTGLQLLGPDQEVIPVDVSYVEAIPRDLFSLGMKSDTRRLENLFKPPFVTTDHNHMWLVPFSFNNKLPKLKINLPRPTKLLGMKVYNYNKNPLDTYRGVKIANLKIENKSIGDIYFTKAPGGELFDFGQFIDFREPETLLSNVMCESATSILNNRSYLNQDFVCPYLPTGTTLKLQILSTWGDNVYVGLNGLAVYDGVGDEYEVDPALACAYPSSVNEYISSQMPKGDSRTVDKLFNHINLTKSPSSCWLAPIPIFGSVKERATSSNFVFVRFPKPVSIGLIKVWNYARTVTRGVRQLKIYLDNILIYSGEIRIAPEIKGNSSASVDFGQSILFTADPATIAREKNNIYRAKSNDVLLVDNGVVLNFPNHFDRSQFDMSSFAASAVSIQR